MANHGSDYTYEYDVFLCFRRGVHLKFIDYLFEALDGIDINTFKDADNEESPTEKEETSPDVLEKIERSRIAVVLFCKDFPYSRRCLDEVAKIMECYEKKTMKLVVPLFYRGTSVTDVCQQEKGTPYEKAFSQHELGKESDKINTWKSALQRIGDLSGINCHKEYETKLISRIVKGISARLPPLRLQIKDVTGLDSRFDEEVKLLLDIGNNDEVHMLAIYGPPGIGKTTFAAHIFNKIISNDDQFTAASFISNIRDKPKFEDLQSTLLDEMCEERKTREKDDTNEEDGEIIKDKLGGKKVLLVLDDVNKIEQLESLAGDCNWFGLGSRIIITTRDPNLLNTHRDRDKIKKYQMRELNDDDSRKLFCWYAFGNSQPAKDFADFTTKALSIARGSPLALKALGIRLKDYELEEWEMELDKYNKVPGALEFLLKSFGVHK
ncbi:hypothetical protein PIB30_034468 [Stylosanthes scabra]|uniref:TIR domain-containing protein n=1 Tax=Stylosanthes scabra TaxID=79078 RepID=A0ABU6UEU3_9FABA|nr:hypothetical protein [Stylosanthes scabra]